MDFENIYITNVILENILNHSSENCIYKMLLRLVTKVNYMLIGQTVAFKFKLLAGRYTHRLGWPF